MTTIYLVRHSIPFKEHGGIEKTNDSILLANINLHCQFQENI